MYSKLNIKDIIIGHKSTLTKGKCDPSYITEFKLLPIIAATVLIAIKVPDNDVKNIFGILRLKRLQYFSCIHLC